MRDFKPNSDSYPYAVAMVGNAWVILHMPTLKTVVQDVLPMAHLGKAAKELNAIVARGATPSIENVLFDIAWNAYELQNITRHTLDAALSSITAK